MAGTAEEEMFAITLPLQILGNSCNQLWPSLYYLVLYSMGSFNLIPGSAEEHCVYISISWAPIAHAHALYIIQQ